ncbi:Alpha-amylase 1 [Hypsizygus marmoreus]|uniref:alpha-amylase n=1 Tax=Hypsizygus marmoreus TaxID=39966 RepID=A0A369K676_HYPMA|nr:Alpha-amylase 1 [Hypsizygus marmoreus]
MRPSTACCAFLPALLLAQSVIAATPDQWRSRSIYQLLTDRFAPSDNSSPTCDTTTRKYCGGTYKGITNHLDYIQNMGFDAVWISPIVENVDNETAYGEAYHGYWTQDINKLNTHFGSQDDLNELSSALHSRGMYLMVDIVVNHFVSVPPNDSDNIQALDYGLIKPFSSESDYHPYCEITDYENQTAVEQCWLGDKKLPLADLDTENLDIVKTMNDWIKGLVKSYNVDGLRIDTVKHVRRHFWPAFAESAGVFTIGEVLSDNTTYTAAYTEVIDSVLDYPTYFPLTEAFKSPEGNLSAVVETTGRIQKTFKNGAFLTGSFLENHDQPRFQSVTQDQALVRNAITWLFVKDGIPILYYGQEQGYTGASDPNNREALWPTAFDTKNPLVGHVKSLNAARKTAMLANSNYTSTPMSFIPQLDKATLVISKPPLVGLLTNVGNSSKAKTTWTIPSSNALFKGGESVVNILNCETTTADADGGLSVQVDAGMPQVLLPVSALGKNGTLCGTGKSGSGGSSTGMQTRISWSVIGGLLVLGLVKALAGFT